MRSTRRAGGAGARFCVWFVSLALVLPWLSGCGDAKGSSLLAKDAIVSLLAVGDTGRPHRTLPALFEGQLAVANGMADEDQRAPVDALLLLGDNFYYNGLRRETMVARIRENLVYPYCRFAELMGTRSAEVASACKLAKEDRHPIPIYAVMGNHDTRSPESAQLQCEEVSSYVSSWHMPCGYSETIEIPGGLSLILFNSEHIPDASEIEELMQRIRTSKGPWRVLAAHRPASLDRTDWPIQTSFVHDVVRIAGVPVHAYLSGHNHSLQLHVTDSKGPPLQAVVGSGARARPPIEGDAPSRRFGASRLGFARVDIVEADGSQRLVLSLFQTPDYPILAWGHPDLVAQWSIGHGGDLRDELNGTPAGGGD